MSDKKVPQGALRFIAPDQKACVFADSDGKEKLEMTVYSGGVIKNHWWWDDLAFDLKGVKFSQNKFPVLEDHITERKIGFTRKPLIDGSIKLDPDKTEFVDSEESLNFRKFSKQGFPYQASLYGVPIRVQRLAEKEEAEVNGFKLKGPATIWREWEFKEASVCVFGWDSNTKSTAFSRDVTEEVDYFEEGGGDEQGQGEEKFSKTLEGGDKTMDLKELKEKHPDLFNQVKEEGMQEGKKLAENEFSKERDTLTAQVKGMADKFSAMEERTARMEKELTLTREVNLKNEADKLFSEMFAECSIEPRLEPKVRNQINHNRFVKDDKLDVEAFKKAVDEELKDWESRMPKTAVMGFSTSGQTDEDESTEEEKKFSQENRSITDDLLARIGQKRKTA